MNQCTQSGIVVLNAMAEQTYVSSDIGSGKCRSECFKLFLAILSTVSMLFYIHITFKCRAFGSADAVGK